MIKVVGHPRGNNKDYVREHIIIAEKALGKPLELPHVVHHFDLDPGNNANQNLVICEDTAYHGLLHKRQRVMSLGGDPNLDKVCAKCKQVKAQLDFHKCSAYSDGLNNLCKTCAIAQANRWQVNNPERSKANKKRAYQRTRRRLDPEVTA